MGFQLNNIEKKKTSASKEKKEYTSFLQKEITIGQPFSTKIKENFYTELSVLLKAGIPLREALVLLEETQKKKKPKEILSGVSNSIVAGQSLSETMQQLSHFTDYEFYSVKIGEETGTLAHVSEQLGSFFERKNEQRRQLINALTYPVIIFSTALLVVAFMLTFVVPMFQEIFKQQGVSLPWITKLIVRLSEFAKSYGWMVLLFLISIPVVQPLLNKNVGYKKRKDQMVNKFPLLGKFMQITYLSQFTQAVALLTASKVPMVHSIELVQKMIPFYPLEHALGTVSKQLISGKSLSDSLSEHRIFDSKMVALVKVAEETNQTAFIFERLNQLYTVQVQQQSKLLSTIMEPFIILFVGLVVGVILIAMYLPMFQLSSVLG